MKSNDTLVDIFLVGLGPSMWYAFVLCGEIRVKTQLFLIMVDCKI